MMRIVLILAAIAAALLVVLALTRGGPKPQMISEPVQAEQAPAVEAAAKPAAATAPEPVAAPPPKPVPLDQQVADDAAAVGMTTREPPAEEPSASEAPKEKK